MPRPIKPEYRIALFALVIGLVLAAMVAGTATAIDWYENPGGIFRSAQGTQWSFVLETFISWFWPFALLTLPVTTVCLVTVRRRIKSEPH